MKPALMILFVTFCISAIECIAVALLTNDELARKERIFKISPANGEQENLHMNVKSTLARLTHNKKETIDCEPAKAISFE